MSTVKLINFNNYKPFYTFNDGKNSGTIYTVQSLGAFNTYIVRSLEYFLKNDSSGILCKVKFNDEVFEFFHTIPLYAKKAMDEWTKEEWTEFLSLTHRKAKLISAVEEVEKAMGSMPYFSDIRKLAKIKRNDLREDKKNNQKLIDSFLSKATEKGHNKIVFGDLDN